MTDPNSPIIELRAASLIYPNGVQALTEVDLRIERGEFVFLVGPTGEGKSTLLKLIYREELPTEGEVMVEGRPVRKIRRGQIPRLRRRVGVVFQDFRLLPARTAWQNVAFAMEVVGQPRREINRRIPELLARVGLADKAGCRPSQLSGGEQQRVSIARALINDPPILLADEPTGNLDPATSWEIVQLLSEINQRGTTVVVATHDQAIVDGMGKRVVEISRGRVVRDDPQGKYHGDGGESP